MSEHLKFSNALPENGNVDKYKITRAFDEDPYSISYLAINTEDLSHVILKEYLPKQFAIRDRSNHEVIPKGPNCKYDYEWGLSQYRDETTELMGLQHPNIINIQACVSANNTIYMVTDSINGFTLEVYSKNITFTETEILALLEPLLSGLQSIHESGYLHSDLNLSNILIEEGSEKPIIIGLGNAKNLLRTKDKNISQTLAPGYASHEQYYPHGKLGTWTDIYAMGAIAYRLATGRTPTPSIMRLSAIVDLNEIDPQISATTLGVDRYSNPFLQAIDHAMMLQINERPESVYSWEEELGISHTSPIKKSLNKEMEGGIEGEGLTISGISDPDDNPSSPVNMDFDALNKPLSIGENLAANSSRYGVIIATIISMAATVAGAAYVYTHSIDKPQADVKNAYEVTEIEEEFVDPIIQGIVNSVPDTSSDTFYTEAELNAMINSQGSGKEELKKEKTAEKKKQEKKEKVAKNQNQNQKKNQKKEKISRKNKAEDTEEAKLIKEILKGGKKDVK